MGIKKAFSALVTDLGNGHNLRRRLYAYLEGAPSKIQGLAGFGVFLARSFVKTDRKVVEPPLSETFASAVVDD